MNENDNFALVPKSSTAVTKVEPGPRRILLGMVVDTLGLAKREPRTRRTIVVLLRGFKDSRWPDLIKAIVGPVWHDHFDFTVTMETLEQEGPSVTTERQAVDVCIVCVSEFPSELRDPDRVETEAIMIWKLWSHHVTGPCSDAWIKRENKEVVFLRCPTWDETLLKAMALCLPSPPSSQIEANLVVSQLSASRPFRVVILDDDIPLREMIKELVRLRFKDPDFLTFSSGDLAYAELVREDPDLFVSDCMHPGLRGDHLVGLLSARGAKYPILVMSGYAREPDVMSKAGPNLRVKFLQKPFRPDDFYWQLLLLFKRCELLEPTAANGTV